MKYLAFSFLVVFKLQAQSSLASVGTELNELLSNQFKELQQEHIDLEEMDSQEFFFETDIRRSSLFIPWKSRQYILRVSPHFLNKNPSLKALHGILAHELQHFSDYKKMSFPQLAWFFLNYSLRNSFAQSYERSTDSKAIARGFGQELIEYRNWLYSVLPPEIVMKKKIYYLNPEEILQEMEKLP